MPEPLPWALATLNPTDGLCPWQDGFVTLEEFIAAMHLAQNAAQGQSLPELLPAGLLIKPSAPTMASPVASPAHSPAEASPDGTLDALLDGAADFMETKEVDEREVVRCAVSTMAQPPHDAR